MLYTLKLEIPTKKTNQEAERTIKDRLAATAYSSNELKKHIEVVGEEYDLFGKRVLIAQLGILTPEEYSILYAKARAYDELTNESLKNIREK